MGWDLGWVHGRSWGGGGLRWAGGGRRRLVVVGGAMVARVR
ncbi:hypothetical protein ACJIZ3_019710 [Penstemon smallii]|uniref:Uncharacterized protein n=1 Tax=Penstemon smallii TaxID=265156 RepID=A0ABD3SJ38_9LAMI